MNIINHGVWEIYSPGELPDGFPIGAKFARRTTDRVDWYEFIYGIADFKPNSVKAVLYKHNDQWICSSANRDASFLFPSSAMLLEIVGFEVDDPQSYYAGKIFDEITSTFSDPAPINQAENIAVSRRQFFQQMAVSSIISEDDALSAVSIGKIPDPLQSIMDQNVDPEAMFSVKMLIVGAQEFRRSHPISALIGSCYGMTPAQIDQFFLDAAQL